MNMTMFYVWLGVVAVTLIIAILLRHFTSRKDVS